MSLKFQTTQSVPDKYCDYSTHSSCRNDGMLVFIWEFERYMKLNPDWKSRLGTFEPWVEIGAIIHEMKYFPNEEGLMDITGDQLVFKPNPYYIMGTGGGLSKEDLSRIIQVMENYKQWWNLPDKTEWTE